MMFRAVLLAVASLPVVPVALYAWDYEGHRIVNQLALASLPKEFPDFVHTPENAERIAFLSGEPDRWRNSPDHPFKHLNAPDHFFDIEDLTPHGLSATNLSAFRYEFTALLAEGRSKNPDGVPKVDPQRNNDRTRQLVGFLPWSITEHYGRLKSAFSYLRAFEEHGTPVEIANARANVVYVMGVMGHYVGDTSQPLHTTKHYNGWVGDNPKGFTTSNRIHSWIDGGFNDLTGLTLDGFKPRVRPAKPLFETVAPAARPHEVFPPVMDYLLESFALVEPLYQLEKDGKLSRDNVANREKNKEGRAFLDGQLLKAGQMLGDLWLTAWREAPPDTFLNSRLITRKHGGQSGE